MPLLLFLFKMNKKVYLAPKAKAILLEANTILAGSGTGATGEDIPWAGAKDRNHTLDDDFNYNYYEEYK